MESMTTAHDQGRTDRVTPRMLLLAFAEQLPERETDANLGFAIHLGRITMFAADKQTGKAFVSVTVPQDAISGLKIPAASSGFEPTI